MDRAVPTNLAWHFGLNLHHTALHLRRCNKKTPPGRSEASGGGTQLLAAASKLPQVPSPRDKLPAVTPQDPSSSQGPHARGHSPSWAEPCRTRSKVLSRGTQPGTRMLPRPARLSAGFGRAFTFPVSCPRCLWVVLLREMGSVWLFLGSDVMPSGPVKQAGIAKARRGCSSSWGTCVWASHPLCFCLLGRPSAHPLPSAQWGQVASTPCMV